MSAGACGRSTVGILSAIRRRNRLVVQMVSAAEQLAANIDLGSPNKATELEPGYFFRGAVVTISPAPFRRFRRFGTVDHKDGSTRRDLSRRAQIGRASCRERVCQYVYISVVACSL